VGLTRGLVSVPEAEVVGK